jgi:hypothetical protein
MTLDLPGNVPALNVNRIREKDVDLLLVEECMAGPDFWRWFLVQGFPELPRPDRLVELRRSVGEIQGESDLELAYTLPDGTVERLLIENKINAELQPKQAIRYRTRGQQYIVRGTCARYRTVLACPQRYLGATPTTLGFDAVVTYEQILGWFAERPELGLRGNYKQAVLRQAIASCQASYVRVRDERVTGFWYSYWQLATKRVPQLELPHPGDRPANASWIRFKPRSFLHGMSIVHQLGRAGVSLEFRKLTTHLALFEREFGDTLEPDMAVVTATGSLAIRITVPLVDRKVPFEMQLAQIQAGQDAAARLHTWFLRVSGRLLPWLQEQRPTVFRAQKADGQRRRSGAPKDRSDRKHKGSKA